jgi:NADH-quinone oxidoreductase subunit H
VELISPTLFLIVFSLLALLLFALMAVWAERKVSAFIQYRKGPNFHGKYGLLQTLADIIKLIQKESIIPSQAHRWLFILAPLIVFLSVFVGFACLPISKDLIGSNTSIGAFGEAATNTQCLAGFARLLKSFPTKSLPLPSFVPF